MTSGLAPIIEALTALRDAGGDRPAEALSPGELLAANSACAKLRQSVDAVLAVLATEIARQSRPELGRDSLAKKQGFRTPAALISAVTGSSINDATRLVTVGEATAPRMTLDGAAKPAKYPHVAAAIAQGGLSVALAGMIIHMLDRVAMRADKNELHRVEQQLATQAVGLRMDELQKLVVRAEALLDPRGAVLREEELYVNRSFSVRQDRTGAIVLNATLDPETGAPVVVAIEGLVSGMLAGRNSGGTNGTGAGGPATGADNTLNPMADQRTVKQMRADALSALCQHAIGCDTVPTAPTATIVVRIGLEALETGTGSATIDGIDLPVTVSAARRIAADAQIIPYVCGGDSEILDWGRAKRLFTPAQKLALAERDGGCAFCGIAPSMTSGHHIEWWTRDRGPTDLRNGILLCTSCHHRIHDDGWHIRIDGAGTRAKVWFTPPTWIDPEQTPRLGGRARYDLVA